MDGMAARKPITTTTQPTTAPAVPTIPLSQLCLTCRSVFDPASPKNEFGEVSHHDLENLAARASRGCHLCLTVYMAIDPDAFRSFRSKASSVGFAWISPIARDQARLKFRYVGTKMDGHREGSRPVTRGSGGSGGSGTGVGALVVELILVNPRHAVPPGVTTLSSNAVSTGSQESLEVAKKWLEECSFNHMRCSVSDATSGWKPTHLLDVTVKGPKGVAGVKLVDGVFLDHFTEYVTLSHCWGRGKTTRLTKTTLPALRQGVAASNLPKTFAEAAETTARLGYRYLWIDALCILHDDEQAVLKEMNQMYKVYSEASLNIAATSSREDVGGLFCARNVAALQPPAIEIHGQGIVDGVYKCLRSTVWRDLVDSSPLSKRAWVFQERCLAKRTLHFTRNEILWECQQMQCSEVFPNGLPADVTSQSSEDVTKHFNKKIYHQRTGNWQDLVQMYSRGRLTYSSDKLLAIAGLARTYGARNRLRELDYLAGLWKSQLPHALLWRIRGGWTPPRYRAPSWSWASLDGALTYPESAQAGRETCVEVMEADIKHKTDRFLLIESASLRVRGFLVRGLLKRTHEYGGRTPCVLQCNRGQLELESMSFDTRLPKLSEIGAGMAEQLEVYLLPIIDTVDRVEGLVLCAMGIAKKKGGYRRIGAFDISRYDQVNWECFKACLKGDPDLSNYEERLDHTANGYGFASDYTYTISLV